MFKIGEFSKITQVSVRMLRYYDENKLLEPAKVDMDTGYRMYSSNQIEQLNRILFLKNLGFQVVKIREFLENWEPEKIRVELENQQKEIEQAIVAENEKLLRLQMSLRDLDKQKLDLNTQIAIKKLPSCHVVSIRRVVADYFCERELWNELGKQLQKCETSKEILAFSIYHDLEQKESDVDIEVCAVIEGLKLTGEEKLIHRQVEEVEKAACFMVYGPYENIAIAYKEFAFWLEQHPQYRMSGENRQICHVGEWNETKPENYVTELQIPIEIRV